MPPTRTFGCKQCGKGSAKKYYQRRTLVQYALLASAGLATFYKVKSPRARAATLGLSFPGAGFVAVYTLPSVVALLTTLATVPLILFMWFGCGGLAFPILLWVGSDLLAALLARETVLESAGAIVTAACVLGITYITWQTQLGNRQAEKKREERNAFLAEAVQENQSMAQQVPSPESREADLRTLRFVQWVLEMGLAPMDDFSYQYVTPALELDMRPLLISYTVLK
ncbi:hypothetical protein EK21DRAFT_84931 [Setomelanomma holmii]|uniref:Uncharacterized protein n=1 Tax=Setomelanomma holmii TaxID=210430 RepID=A0A9P4HJQ8_9PLEO|nr:hypothetical protein EK21DRAFT_84931 [Setomelanomma holmii]